MTEVAVSRRSVLPERLVSVRLASDERLATLVSRGDTRAFATLYERHQVVLYRYCHSIVRNDHDAQDALQSAAMRALAALQAQERELAVRPWLFRIVHNEAISLLRRRRPEDRPIDGQELAHVSVEHTVEDRERLATLVVDIQSLGERQRGALLMRELSGLSIEEIAAALSTTTGAAKQALFEARCALHDLAEGRAMECEAVRQTLSERDGRVLRGRKLRAHLRACASCVQFRTLIDARSVDLRMLVPPLPATAAIGLLAHAAHVGGGSASATSAAGAGAASGMSLGLSTPAAVSLVAKGLAGAALMTAAGAGTAELARHHHVVQAPHSVAAPTSTMPAAPALLHGTAHRLSTRATPQPYVRRVANGVRPEATRDTAQPDTPSAARSEEGATQPTPAALSAPAAASDSSATAPATGNPTGGTGASQGASRSTLPGQAKKGSVGPGQAKQNAPPGLAKQDKVPPGQARKDADAQPSTSSEDAPAVNPDQDAPASNPGHSGDTHGRASQGGQDAASGSPSQGHGHH